MTALTRNLADAEATDHDIIIVGGGVHGVALTLEAARRGYRPLLIERADFNSGTSWVSLRIIHGGLRYLQSMDIRRFFESVSERRWFLRNFPDLVGVMPCLMPLYNRGLKRRCTFGPALKLNDALSFRRNLDVRADRHIPSAGLIDNAQVAELFPRIDQENLRGGGRWFDGVMRQHQRLVIEMLRWAADAGATCLNYTQVNTVTTHGGSVRGVEATDQTTGQTHAFTAPLVINAAGPHCAAFAEHVDQPQPELFRPSMAFNLLLDHDPLSSCAVALEPKTPDARTYFVLPWTVNGKPRIFAGTFHCPWPAGAPLDNPQPTQAQIDTFLSDLNTAVPGLALGREHVMRTYCGLLPAEHEGTEETAHRPVWIEHGKHGGPAGLFSVSGVKYTTARLIAEQTLHRVFGPKLRAYRPAAARPAAQDALDFQDYRPNMDNPDAIRRVAQLESVVNLDDMIHRRTDWGADPAAEEQAREALRNVLDLGPAPPTVVGADAA